MPAVVPIAASVAGAAVSGAMSKGSSGGGQSSKQEPWSAVQPWLKENIEGGQALQDYYQRNPFNPIQQAGYGNMLGDMDYFRQTMAPALMGQANRMMGASYQRAPAGSELGGLNPYAPGNGNNFNSPNVGLASAGGQQSMSGAMPAAQGQAAPGLLGTGTPMPKPYLQDAGMGQAQGVFSSPAGVGYSGLLDWQGLNPWTSILAEREKADANKKPSDLTNDEIIEDWMRRNDPGYSQREYTRRWGDGGA